MKLSIEIDLDDDAMAMACDNELAYLFRQVRRSMLSGAELAPLKDSNGNTIGRLEITA
ncbi:MAG: hypothetical protein V3S43_06215 [Acidimicrobiia bacterium]